MKKYAICCYWYIKQNFNASEANESNELGIVLKKAEKSSMMIGGKKMMGNTGQA